MSDVTAQVSAAVDHAKGKASIVDLQTEVVAAREEFLASLSELQSALQPGALAQRGLRSVAGWFTDEHGGVRPERVAIVGAAVVGVVAIRFLARRR